MTDDNSRKIEELKATIATLNQQRAILGDQVVASAVAALQAQILELTPKNDIPEQQRKLVTILFLDIMGSTRLTRDLDPEDNMEIIDRALLRLAAPIEKQGGRVTRYTGDGFKSLFGMPVARENDPEMAIRAGLEILGVGEVLAEELKHTWGLSGLQVRIGIDTGLAIIGGYSEAEDTVKGNPVNLASRLETAAPPGGILISHHTFQQVRGIFEVKAVEPVEAKGFEDPVPAYQVIRLKRKSFRASTRGIEDIETRMIGREAPFSTLQKSYQTMLEGETCRVVTIVGEAGVGKSRLLFEFEKWLADRLGDIEIFRGRCSPEMQNRPFSLFRDIFSFHFDIQDSDSSELVRQKMIEGISNVLGSDENAQMRAIFIGQLVGFDFSTNPFLQGVLEDSRQFRDRAGIYLTEYFQASIDQKPALLFLDDIHWADDSSLEMFGQMVGALSDESLFSVCIARPILFERRKFWGEGQTYFKRIHLEPLSRRDSRNLVREVLQKADQVPPILQELIVAGAEGNPFYIEELVKKLIEDGVILKTASGWRVIPEQLQQLTVPPTLTGVLQARLESLPETERSILQQASVVGRLFWDQAIIQLGNDSGKDRVASEVTHALAGLGEKEMIFPRKNSAFAGTQEYIFKNTMMRDVTYESVLRRDRRTLHERSANWLVENVGERAGEYVGMIAEHLELSGNPGRAAGYLRQAGEEAAKRWANTEAIGYLTRALELTGESSIEERFKILLAREQVFSLLGERVKQLADLEVLEGLVGSFQDDRLEGEVALLRATQASEISNYPRIIASAQETIRLGKASQEKRLETRGHLLWGRALVSQGDYVPARAHFTNAYTLARDCGLLQAEADSLRNLGILDEQVGDVSQAVTRYEQALETFRKIGDRRGEGQTLNGLGNILMKRGDWERGKELYDEFLQISKEIGDRWSVGIVLRNIADMHLNQANLVSAGHLFEQALSINQDLRNKTLEVGSLLGLGIVALERADFSKAIEQFESVLQIARGISNRPTEAKTLAQLGIFFHRQGDFLRAQSYYEQSHQLYTELGNTTGLGRVLSYLALLAQHLGDFEKAIDRAQEALRIGRERSNEGLCGLALMELGSARLGLGKLPDARQDYETALRIFLDTDNKILAFEARAGLARVALASEEPTEALRHLEPVLAAVQELIQGDVLAAIAKSGHGLEGSGEPLRIFLTCYESLEACGDPRAQKVLEATHLIYSHQVQQIEDLELRHAFQANLPVNQAIQKAWVAHLASLPNA